MDERFYPELSETALKDAENFIEGFRNEMKETLEGILRQSYCDYLPWIETDSWTNMRTQMQHAILDYKNNSETDRQFYKSLRDKILKENREELIRDLNQDLLEEIESLKNTIEMMNKNRY